MVWGMGEILLFLLVIVLFPLIIKELKKEIVTKEDREARIEEYFDDGGEIVETRSEVVDMACGTKMVGTKTVKSLEWYVIVFKDDLGKIIEVPVNQEMYEGFEIGMHGTLKLVDGVLYSFEAKNSRTMGSGC